MKKNNAGISLMEVIAVVAILIILTGTGAYGISQMTGFRAREAADKVASSIAENKVETLGKAKSSGVGGMAWEIYCDDDDFYIRTVYDVGSGETYSDAEQINDGKVEVKIGQIASGGETWFTLDDGAAYRIFFNRATGALCNAAGSELGCNIIVRVSSGQKEYDVEVISKTGKVISETVKKD